jgi:hypothetical protein
MPTMTQFFNNLEDMHTVEMPPGDPKVYLDQTWERLKEGAPTKGTLISNFEQARQWSHYDNHKGMHAHIDTMTENFAKEEEKSYHLYFPRSFLYFIPGLMVALLSLILQKEKIGSPSIQQKKSSKGERATPPLKYRKWV